MGRNLKKNYAPEQFKMGQSSAVSPQRMIVLGKKAAGINALTFLSRFNFKLLIYCANLYLTVSCVES
jgi:hypothetical protein